MAPISSFEMHLMESAPASVLIVAHVINLAMTIIYSLIADKNSEKKQMLDGDRFKFISELKPNEMTMEEKQHALLSAAKENNLISVQKLLKAGAYHSAPDKEEYTPLHWAAARGNLDIAQTLLDSGANIENKGGKKFHFTPLHLASGEGHLEMCRMLLDRGAHVMALDRYRNTALHWAAWFGHLSVVQLLIERGINTNTKNSDGQTAQDMAAVRRNHKITDWFEQQ
ncbi:hypothetical protein L9F63_000298 [Diploptera punctata]|uniref:Uncharacterized protein n=1 Tax=Diploptera punctata TaxID=6984 RepID=A0AAD8ESI1_DIPPU|nr:hypothetical protein L9F63_000298 [Diploptera punctata]